MARHTAQQLPLPYSLDEATTLLEQLTLADQELRWRHAKIDALQEQLDQGQADRATWRAHTTTLEQMVRTLRQERELVQLALQRVQLQLQATELRLALQTTPQPPAAEGLPPWLDHALGDLVVLGHPDRWSAGQDATALAHEVASAVNGLRQRLGEGT